jgi:hypothetical protein
LPHRQQQHIFLEPFGLNSLTAGLYESKTRYIMFPKEKGVAFLEVMLPNICVSFFNTQHLFFLGKTLFRLLEY